jgi:hypothetical protein
MIRRLCIAFLGLFMAAACQREAPVPLGTGQQAIVLAPGPGGVFTSNCEAACNAADTICGTVQDPANPQLTCCCIGGCPDWGPTCAAGVADGSIGPGESPVGGGVFTGACEQACNASNTTCGTVANAAGQTCCCVGSCPQWGATCAAGVADGTLGPGAVIGPGNGPIVIGIDIAGDLQVSAAGRLTADGPPVTGEDPDCAGTVTAEIAAAIAALAAVLPCDGGAPECVAQVITDLLIGIQPVLIEEQCAGSPVPPTPPAAGVLLQPVPRQRLLTRGEFEAIAIYIGSLSTAIFNRGDNPKTFDLAAAESKALDDKMLAIVKAIRAEVDNRRGGARLNDRDAQGWFDDLSKNATSLKKALDKIAADVNQPKAVRDAAKERSERVQKWIDKLDLIKAGGTFTTRDLATP